MTLNFPENPADQDVYLGYIYNATKGVWDKKPITTDEITEGSANLYFTDARAQSAVATDISNAIDALDTDDIEEGTTNLYFTNQRAIDGVKDNIELDDLSDVDTTGVADGDALVYDTDTTSWVPGSVAIDALNDINDVTITTSTTDQLLVYNGAAWVNDTAKTNSIANSAVTSAKIANGNVTANEIASNAVTNVKIANNTITVAKISGGGFPLIETETRTANYTLVLLDNYKVVPFNSTSNRTLTIPTNASVAFPIGAIVNVYNLNTGNVNIVGASGVTVRNAGALEQYGEASLRKRSTNEWVLAGNVS